MLNNALYAVFTNTFFQLYKVSRFNFTIAFQVGKIKSMQFMKVNKCICKPRSASIKNRILKKIKLMKDPSKIT